MEGGEVEGLVPRTHLPSYHRYTWSQGHTGGHRTDEMMTHLDGLCVTVDGKLVPASLEILVTTVLGGRGFLQRI